MDLVDLNEIFKTIGQNPLLWILTMAGFALPVSYIMAGVWLFNRALPCIKELEQEKACRLRIEETMLLFDSKLNRVLDRPPCLYAQAPISPPPYPKAFKGR